METVHPIFGKIVKDSKLLEDFLAQESLDDMYVFCLKLGAPFTREEFDNFVFDILESSGEEEAPKPLTSGQESDVTGGLSDSSVHRLREHFRKNIYRKSTVF